MIPPLGAVRESNPYCHVVVVLGSIPGQALFALVTYDNGEQANFSDLKLNL